MTTRKSYLHKIVLSGALICITSLLNAEIKMPKTKQTQQITQLTQFNIPKQMPKLEAEQEKWTYLRKIIDIKNENNYAFTQELGALIKNNSVILTAAFQPIVTYLIFEFFAGRAREDFETQTPITPRKKPGALRPKSTHVTQVTKKTELSSIDKKQALQIGISISTGTLCWFLANYVTKKIGLWLEAKPQACQDALAGFFRQWHTHKKNIPTVLLPEFKKIHDDFDMQTRSFKRLTQEQAVKIVEAIITVSILGEQQIDTKTFE
ncbi:MAG: hypothetical protein ABH827_06760 [bacterium]